ncbi:MAG: M1 family metallopeptidase [Anaerolineae bacterium]|nr:M1 family metallopeptidase [Anaerolineae bacterium]
MRRLAILVLALIVFLPARASSAATDNTAQLVPIWPDVTPIASYDIQVALDIDTKMVSGHETITYTNSTDTPIPDVVFHLYLNAFRDSTSSIFMQESGSLSRGYSFDPDYPGGIEITDIRLADGTTLELDLIEDETLAKAELPEPVAPGETLNLEVEFQSTLPKVFARTGFYKDFFMVGQWFPKLGVWQDGGWNAYPFHSNSEFFADFGNYDVAITLPDNYVTGATGLLASTKANNDGTQTVSYHAEAVIDFAWAASPNFKQATRDVGGLEVVYIYLPEHAFTIDRALDATEAAVTNFGAWYGAYPYPRLTVLDVPDEASGAGGMEYPMLVTAGLEDPTGLGLMKGQYDHMLEIVTIHEIGHEWWYAVVAFNEAEEPWLDEGITDYSTVRLMEKEYGPHEMLDMGSIKMSYLEARRMEYLMMPETPMYGKAWDFGTSDYGVGAYSKPVISLLTLEGVIGEERMLKVMSTFFERYRFKHPTTEDFRATAEEVSGQNLDWFFDGLVYGKEILNYSVSSVEEHRVTVTRQGSLIIPTEVQVTFADGSEALEAWDGSEAQKTFDYSDRPAVVRAEIDPDHKLLVDLQWSDNGLLRRMDVWSWLAINCQILYQIQNMLLGEGGL